MNFLQILDVYLTSKLFILPTSEEKNLILYSPFFIMIDNALA